MSTNAPKSITFLTVPFNTIPSFRSSNFKTSDLKICFGISSLGSLPGFDNSSIISFKVISLVFNFLLVSFILIFANFSFIVFSPSLSLRSCFLQPISFNKFSAIS